MKQIEFVRADWTTSAPGSLLSKAKIAEASRT